jgi:hypothetical protein
MKRIILSMALPPLPIPSDTATAEIQRQTQLATRRALIELALLDVALVWLGLALYPAVLQAGGLLGASGATLMVCVYGYLALYSPFSISRTASQVWRPAAAAGALAGIWLGLDLLSNYFIYRDGATNSKISLVVYGVYFLLLLGTAARGSMRAKRFAAGLKAALWFTLAAQLIWFAVEFGAYYLFSHTAVGMQFIQTEMGTDFARSGGNDFQAFAIGDFFGAGFFHLLLIGLLAMLVIGCVGGGISLLAARWRKG